jgi:type IV secretory pathway VirB10-like protein
MKLNTEHNEYGTYRPGEVHLHIRFRPASVIGIAIVLILHGLLLYFLWNIRTPKKNGDEAAQSPLVLLIDKATALKMSKPLEKKTQTKPVKATKQNKPTTPVILSEVMKSLPPPPDKITPPELDMSSMLEAARERRRAAQAAVQESQEAQQGNRGMSPQEAAEANVRRSMQQASGRQGTNGVFQIISKSTRTASFSFKGWKASANNSWRQVIEVDAGLGGNVELAIVRRMIELIRTHYSGDFSWESQRLGRVINLSARPQDSAELETFMMREFFSNPGDR